MAALVPQLWPAEKFRLFSIYTLFGQRLGNRTRDEFLLF